MLANILQIPPNQHRFVIGAGAGVGDDDNGDDDDDHHHHHHDHDHHEEGMVEDGVKADSSELPSA